MRVRAVRARESSWKRKLKLPQHMICWIQVKQQKITNIRQKKQRGWSSRDICRGRRHGGAAIETEQALAGTKWKRWKKRGNFWLNNSLIPYRNGDTLHMYKRLDIKEKWTDVWDPASVGEKNEKPFYKSVKISLWQTCLESLKGKPKKKSPKKTISAHGGHEPLQLVSESDIERCASEEAVPRRGVDTRQCARKDAWPQRG